MFDSQKQVKIARGADFYSFHMANHVTVIGLIMILSEIKENIELGGIPKS